MIPDNPSALLVFVDAADTAAGHCGWSTVVVHPEGTRIVTGNIRGATRDVGLQTALHEALDLAASAGGDACFDIVVAGAYVIPVRSGEAAAREEAGPLGEAARFVEVARNLAEGEALRAGNR